MPDAIPPARYVFVYGTLRRGDDNDITRLLPSPQYVGDTVINGVMYHLGAYPGVILGQPHTRQDAGPDAGTGQIIGVQLI